MCDRSQKTVGRVSHNETYEKDIRYAFQLCQLVLRPIGIWPRVYHRASRFERVISMITMSLCLFSFGIVLIPFGNYAIFVEKDMDVKIKFIGPLIYAVTSTVKYCYLVSNGSNFKRCIEHVENDWRNVHEKKHRDIMIRNVALGRNLTIISAVFLFAGDVSYDAIMPFLLEKQVKDNVTIRPFPHPGMETFFVAQATPYYEMIYCTHCFYAFVTCSIITAICSLAAMFVTHACGQIQIQMTRLVDLVHDNNNKTANGEDPLAVIVKAHVKVLQFSKEVEEVLRDVCLFEIGVSTLNICMLEYYCLMEWKNSELIAIVTYVMLLCSYVTNVLIFCYIGELLVDQASKIGAASYDTEWYDLPEKKALGLVLMMIMSNHPPKLTAGRIMDLSLNTFSTVLKTSVVYLNLLRTVTENEW